jgi:translation elongation factor EF-Tu-like GTPase
MHGDEIVAEACKMSLLEMGVRLVVLERELHGRDVPSVSGSKASAFDADWEGAVMKIYDEEPRGA